jgi:hypothetical protein
MFYVIDWAPLRVVALSSYSSSMHSSWADFTTHSTQDVQQAHTCNNLLPLDIMQQQVWQQPLHTGEHVQHIWCLHNPPAFSNSAGHD